MAVTLQLVGPLRNYANGEAEVYSEPGLTIREAVKSLSIPPEIIALVVVNGEIEVKDYVLQEGDVIKLMAVIGGG